MWQQGPWLGVADGPTEVHKDVVAKALLRDVAQPEDPLFGSEHIPTRLDAARKKFAGRIEHLLAAQ
jgi:acyl-CoA dehydrogenase